MPRKVISLVSSKIALLICLFYSAWPVQGLIRHFRPELEARMANFQAKIQQ
jgi:hypothetical protein